jgi:hypothetical protein
MNDPALTAAIADLALQVRRLVLTRTPFENWTEGDMRLMQMSEEEIARTMQCRNGAHFWKLVFPSGDADSFDQPPGTLTCSHCNAKKPP